MQSPVFTKPAFHMFTMDKFYCELYFTSIPFGDKGLLGRWYYVADSSSDWSKLVSCRPFAVKAACKVSSHESETMTLSWFEGFRYESTEAMARNDHEAPAFIRSVLRNEHEMMVRFEPTLRCGFETIVPFYQMWCGGEVLRQLAICYYKTKTFR